MHDKNTMKNVKITKEPHAYKSNASTYNVEILNCFNSLNYKLKISNLQLK